MSVASLVLGIVSAVFCWIPFCGTWALIPAIVGIILGAVDMVKLSKAGKPKGMAIAGLVLNIVAVVIIIIWWLALGAALASV